ncbi:uncharacterized protein LOC107042774 [Diachasma alloeum]|uniref:uncharacterized protein LOC107042774 n=1 Tax=Diachasma alloeum TaxID=454923 RepID=UPI0007383A8F|nr:uncharacterized protein LOC107042774 [Diachasma alloeum]
MCRASGFPLAKWHNNCEEFLLRLSPDSISRGQRFFKDTETRILGISWRPTSDHFVFTVKPVSSLAITKRVETSEIAQLFDPLGFLCPVIIRSKALLQELWIGKFEWDDKLPDHLCEKWKQFREDLENLKDVEVPRWWSITEKSRLEIQGFLDTSQVAMAAMTKVAPVQRLTIPCLEFSAALLLAKLTSYVQTQLNLIDVRVFLWTDSAITLACVSPPPSRWKEFMKNGVLSVQGTVPGKQNSADCASRDLSVL